MPTPRERIREWSRKIQRALDTKLPQTESEADLRRLVDPLLEQFCHELGLNPSVRSEYTLATGRADAVFNRFVIEYERPGSLKAVSDRATQLSIGQVKRYIEELAQKERHQVERLAGVAFDGHQLAFVRWVNRQWAEVELVPVTLDSVERMLTWLAGLASGTALTPENLSRDFSIEQGRTQQVLQRLFEALQTALEQHHALVSKLFEQWRLLFDEAIDYSEAFGGRKLEPLKKWVRKAGLEVRDAKEAERFFFVLHTYFALLAKLLAWLALSRHLGVRLGGPSFSELLTTDSATLRKRLEEMESGGIFRAYGILNLLEGDFFAWYLHAWSEKVENALRDILKRLDGYDPTTLTIVPEETRDLFKKLYHYLLPREIRHNLGEYYTPDWLAWHLLKQVDNEFFDNEDNEFFGGHNAERLRRRLLETRFLDPACGSGTFLVLILGRMRQLGRDLRVPEAELLKAMISNVVGFDLNPLAVLTARVNYLLAIADLLEHREGEITIPVYLADSVRTPVEGKELFSQGTYEFPTTVGKFKVPAVLCQPGRFDRFCNLLEEGVRSSLNVDDFLAQLEKELALTGQPGWDEDAKQLLRELYGKLSELHQKGLNGIWARLLKNNFAPLTVGQFDYIVGNPPWVN
ncbi:MAG: hypothetical protein C4335_10865, partial [Armatimonadota bacterium]